MADNRKEYTVTIGGVEHTLLLSAEDAERYGEDAKQADQPANKSRTAQNKSDK